MLEPLHLIADALDVPREDEETECRLCGQSPFATAGRAKKVFGAGFSDWELCKSPLAPDVCAGCARIMSGRPGDDPPPLRTRSWAIVDGALHILGQTGIWAILREPPAEQFLLSWATSKKKHHPLRAGISSPVRYAIGSDEHTIEYVPAIAKDLLDAVEELLTNKSFSRTAIQTGTYHPQRITKFGAARWSQCESVVANWRGRPLLNLVTYCAPVQKNAQPQSKEIGMIEVEDRRAAELLGALARGSKYRIEHGKEFWAGFFRHRVERFRRLPLAQMVSRLLDELQITASSEGSEAAVSMLKAWNPDEQEAVRLAILNRPSLVVALSYDLRKLKANKSIDMTLFEGVKT